MKDTPSEGCPFVVLGERRTDGPTEVNLQLAGFAPFLYFLMSSIYTDTLLLPQVSKTRTSSQLREGAHIKK